MPVQPTRCPFCLVALLLGGCTLDRGYLSSSVASWTEQTLAIATPGVQVAIGVSALAAEVCAMDYAAWSAADTSGLTLSTEVADWFGLDPSGSVTRDTTTGQYSVLFTGGSVTLRKGQASEAMQVRISATEPQAEIGVKFEKVKDTGPEDTGPEDTGSDDAVRLLNTQVKAMGCDETQRMVSALVRPTDGRADPWWVDVPEGDVAERYLILEAGRILPFQGRMSWQGSFEDTTVIVVTDDATTIQPDGHWGASVEGPGWSGEGELVFE